MQLSGGRLQLLRIRRFECLLKLRKRAFLNRQSFMPVSGTNSTRFLAVQTLARDTPSLQHQSTNRTMLLMCLSLAWEGLMIPTYDMNKPAFCDVSIVTISKSHTSCMCLWEFPQWFSRLCHSLREFFARSGVYKKALYRRCEEMAVLCKMVVEERDSGSLDATNSRKAREGA